MPAETMGSSPDRFRPHAVREMAGMFDDVSGRYDLLNGLMTLGQDRAWREAMWAAVPADARVVLDLCTGSGASLPGLRRPGRLVLGADVSLRMLEHATALHGGPGWSPRLTGADAFQLPLRDGALDALTLAFGPRNLRPLDRALAEMHRVLRPGGTLVVLEATAPAPGPFAPFHAFHVRHVVPLLGRLSPDPSAYEYLSRSIFEFGDGSAFERELEGGGFEIVQRRAFLLGATRLWVARRGGVIGQKPSEPPTVLRNAWPGRAYSPEPAAGPAATDAERRIWGLAQLAVSAVLFAALLRGLIVFLKWRDALPLEPWQRSAGLALLVLGVLTFGVRLGALLLRFPGPRPRR